MNMVIGIYFVRKKRIFAPCTIYSVKFPFFIRNNFVVLEKKNDRYFITGEKNDSSTQ